MNAPAKPPHNRKLGILGVALVKARFPKCTGSALDTVRNELEAHLISSGVLTGAPFFWVTIAIRYGLKDQEQPVFQRINQKYGDLPLAIEVDSHRILNGDEKQITEIFREAATKALLAASKRYERPLLNSEK